MNSSRRDRLIHALSSPSRIVNTQFNTCPGALALTRCCRACALGVFARSHTQPLRCQPSASNVIRPTTMPHSWPALRHACSPHCRWRQNVHPLAHRPMITQFALTPPTANSAICRLRRPARPRKTLRKPRPQGGTTRRACAPPRSFSANSRSATPLSNSAWLPNKPRRALCFAQPRSVPGHAPIHQNRNAGASLAQRHLLIPSNAASLGRTEFSPPNASALSQLTTIRFKARYENFLINHPAR